MNAGVTKQRSIAEQGFGGCAQHDEAWVSDPIDAVAEAHDAGPGVELFVRPCARDVCQRAPALTEFEERRQCGCRCTTGASFRAGSG